MKTIQDVVKERNIKCLWHFTRLENLDSILTRGIIPRATLEEENSDVEFNDLYRWDGQKDASCFSIGHPNYKMFYKLRQENLSQEWVVIACKPSVLWEQNCAFCSENAASNNVSNTPINYRKTVTAFESIFSPVIGKPSRQDLRLSDDYPTNPQSEILVFATVEPKYIVGAVCQKEETKFLLREKYSNFQIISKSSPFSYRYDFEHWR